MLNKIVVENIDGTIVIHTLSEETQTLLNMNDADFETYAESRFVQQGLNPVGKESGASLNTVQEEDWSLVNDLPVYSLQADIRHFRNLWIWDHVNNEIIIDSTKLNDFRIHSAFALRDFLLSESDDEFLESLESPGHGNSPIKQYRHDLRDMDSAINADPTTVVFPVKP